MKAHRKITSRHALLVCRLIRDEGNLFVVLCMMAMGTAILGSLSLAPPIFALAFLFFVAAFTLPFTLMINNGKKWLIELADDHYQASEWVALRIAMYYRPPLIDAENRTWVSCSVRDDESLRARADIEWRIAKDRLDAIANRYPEGFDGRTVGVPASRLLKSAVHQLPREGLGTVASLAASLRESLAKELPELTELNVSVRIGLRSEIEPLFYAYEEMELNRER